MTRRKSDITKDICRECHKTIHGLFEHRELRDGRTGLGTIEGLLAHPKFQKALAFIRKVPPGAYMAMSGSKSKRRR